MWWQRTISALRTLSRFTAAVPLLWQISFYCVPLAFVFAVSFWVMRNYQVSPALTLNSYRIVVQDPIYGNATLYSLAFATSTAALASLLAFPLSYAIRFYVSSRARGLLIFSLFVPFFSSYLIRVSAWQLWLGDNGILAYCLRRIGVRVPFSIIYTPAATTIGLLSILVPIASLVIYMGLAQIDETLVLAARNLGASRQRTFIQIEIPLCIQSIAVSILLAFIISLGDFMSQGVLGGSNLPTLSMLIIDRVKILDWPTAGVLGVIMLSLSVLCILGITKFIEALPVVRRTGRLK